MNSRARRSPTPSPRLHSCDCSVSQRRAGGLADEARDRRPDIRVIGLGYSDAPRRVGIRRPLGSAAFASPSAQRSATLVQNICDRLYNGAQSRRSVSRRGVEGSGHPGLRRRCDLSRCTTGAISAGANGGHAPRDGQFRGTPWDESWQLPTYGSSREWSDLVFCVANGHNRTRFHYDTVEVPGSSPVVPTRKIPGQRLKWPFLEYP